MHGPTNLAVDVHVPSGGGLEEMARDVREGLSAPQRRLSSKYFYDERGSLLFERITTLPEYYLTRAEEALLRLRADEIIALVSPEELVELGAGAAAKTRRLIDAGLAAGCLRRFVPVDVSQEMVEGAARELAESYPDLDIHAVVGDFDHHLGRLPEGAGRLILFLGSTIGNFVADEAVEFLAKVGREMGPGDWLLLGTDLVKDPAILEAAYNDSAGVTAEFNRNILDVVNRGLDGNFDPRSFEHVARYNEAEARIESYLRSTRRQRVRLEAIDLDVEFARDELLQTEVSCKYTRDSASRLLERAGLRLTHWFTDDDRTFGLSLSKRIILPGAGA